MKFDANFYQSCAEIGFPHEYPPKLLVDVMRL
jgi:hypothetical protein